MSLLICSGFRPTYYSASVLIPKSCVPYSKLRQAIACFNSAQWGSAKPRTLLFLRAHVESSHVDENTRQEIMRVNMDFLYVAGGGINPLHLYIEVNFGELLPISPPTNTFPEA